MLKKDNRKKVVFLGTPEVAARVLEILLNEAASAIQIVLVVSQPPARSTRQQDPVPSPVHRLALLRGIPVMTPETAKDISFLKDLEELKPDLCITAAYGNYLPSSFISIPKFGTLNIHPSLLPLYRGAAPVQRAIENGDKVTGVTVLYSTAKMDAGPIVAQESYTIEDDIKAPELLSILFDKGTRLLISVFQKIFLNALQPIEQDETKTTHASKITMPEGLLDFSLPAEKLHNKVRAFTPWPGTKAVFFIDNKLVEVKIITTKTYNNERNIPILGVSFQKNSIDVCCGDGRILEILELQQVGKRALSARDFQNGIQGKIVKIS
jgi:methionyl-tRNA formyltransferase